MESIQYLLQQMKDINQMSRFSKKGNWPRSQSYDSTDKWLTMHGVPVGIDHKVILYKAVDKDLHSTQTGSAARWNHGEKKVSSPYTVGKRMTDPLFKRNGSCGAGLHLSPTPRAAKDYNSAATRYLACEVKIKDIDVLRNGSYRAPKVKVPTLKVLYEVNIDGNKLGKNGKPAPSTYVGKVVSSRKSGHAWDVVHQDGKQVVLRALKTYKIVKLSNLRKSFVVG